MDKNKEAGDQVQKDGEHAGKNENSPELSNPGHELHGPHVHAVDAAAAAELASVISHFNALINEANSPRDNTCPEAADEDEHDIMDFMAEVDAADSNASGVSDPPFKPWGFVIDDSQSLTANLAANEAAGYPVNLGPGQNDNDNEWQNDNEWHFDFDAMDRRVEELEAIDREYGVWPPAAAEVPYPSELVADESAPAFVQPIVVSEAETDDRSSNTENDHFINQVFFYLYSSDNEEEETTTTDSSEQQRGPCKSPVITSDDSEPPAPASAQSALPENLQSSSEEDCIEAMKSMVINPRASAPVCSFADNFVEAEDNVVEAEPKGEVMEKLCSDHCYDSGYDADLGELESATLKIVDRIDGTLDLEDIELHMLLQLRRCMGAARTREDRLMHALVAAGLRGLRARGPRRETAC